MARFRLLAGPVPLHHQVYLDLRSAIEAGEWRPGDRLPPERELAERYGCSLITVRRALGDLARERRLERTRGRGTFVTRPPIDLDLDGTMSFTEELQHLGHDPATRVVTARTIPADHAVAEALEIGLGASVVHLERLRMADGEPLLLEQVFLPEARFPGLLASDLEHGSLYDLLTERYDTPVTRAREALEPIALPAREAQLLGVEPHRPALLIEGLAYDRSGRPVELARSYVRGDRTRYYVERVVVRSGRRSGEAAPGAADAGIAGARRHT
jgi:GntR family transcriptional regulator, N-acetylglucosamine utilization regulator